jgi:hypothetical protein
MLLTGVVCHATLVEAKGVIPNLAQEWAGSLAGLLLQRQEDFAQLAPIEPVKVRLGFIHDVYCVI